MFARSRSTKKTKKFRLESIKMVISQRRLLCNKTYYKSASKVSVKIAQQPKPARETPPSHTETLEYVDSFAQATENLIDIACKSSCVESSPERRKVFSRHESKQHIA